MYKVDKKLHGVTVSLFKSGLPSTVTLNDETPQNVLEYLYSIGMEGITKSKNGSDNKSGNN